MIITYWPYSDIILGKVKWLKWDEPISSLRSNNDLDKWIALHFCTSALEGQSVP
jgi:hypothetical protein